MKLSEKIWLTRKARIEAATRLEKYDFYSLIIINYYSVFIVILSIWNLYHQSKDMPLLIVSASILILTVSLFISTRNFKARALELKNCYIKLDEIYRSVVKAEEEKSNDLDELAKKYNDILLFSENHSLYDYLTIKYDTKDQQKDENQKIKRYDILKFFCYKTFRILTFLFLLSIPILLIYYMT